MVLLTMTTSIVEALQARGKAAPDPALLDQSSPGPSLKNPAAGQPISHGQVVDLWKTLGADGKSEYTLEKLLVGSNVYVPPPAPKPRPSDEYKALMARLRREEEQRAYERMLNPPPTRETFAQRFPTAPSSMSNTFAETHRPLQADLGDDDVTYDEVHRQMMLILNFVLSIGGVAATLWVLARWWSTPARLMLTMAGSALVGVAEVALYSGYIWHLSDAKKKEKKVREVKQVMQTWVVGSGEEPAEKDVVLLPSETIIVEPGIRRRYVDTT